MRWSLFVLSMQLVFGEAVLAASGDVWRVTGNNVNLRRGPSTVDESKRQLHAGQEVIERDRRGEWYRVEITGTDGLLGWVHHSLLQVPARPIAQRPLPAPGSSQPEATVRKAFMEKQTPASAMSFPDEEVILDQMREHVTRREKLPKEAKPPQVGHSGREIISPVPIRKPGDQSRIPTELVLASVQEQAGIDPEAMEVFRDSVSYLNSRAWSVAGIKLFSEIEPVGGGVVQVKTTDDWFDVPKIGQTSYLNTLVDRWASAKADGTQVGVMLVDPKGDLLMHQTKP